MTHLNEEQMREQFEWHAQNPQVGGIKLSIEKSPEPFDNGDYMRRETQCAWEAWQSATEQMKPLVEAAKSARKVLRAAARVNTRFGEKTNRAIQAAHELQKLEKALATIEQQEKKNA